MPYAFCEQIGKEIRDISDEIPFEIPESWEWVRLGTLAQLISDGTHKTPHYVDSGIPFLSVQNISKGYFDLTKIKYITEEEHQKLIERVKPKINDILICRIGTLGKAIKITVDFEFSIFVSLGLIRLIDTTLIDFIITAINSPLGLKWIDENKVGGGTHTYKINLVDLPNMLIPIPPIAEQHRIVAKIEELLPYIERYGKAEEHLTALNTTFPEALKKSILQEAVQGKLVPQNPDDEPASVLLERIRAEKQALIKAGKIKKDKHESVIVTRDKIPYEIIDGKERCIADEVPFELPDSWCWCRLGTIFQHNTGKALNSSNHQGTKMQYITTSNLYWDRFELDKLKEMLFTDSEVEKCTVTKGDLLVCEGGDIGRAAIWNFDYPMRIQNHIHRLRSYAPVEVYFFYYVFYLYKRAGLIGGKGIGIQGLSSNAIDKLLIPLPPLSEQKRIVAKIEELMQYCDKL